MGECYILFSFWKYSSIVWVQNFHRNGPAICTRCETSLETFEFLGRRHVLHQNISVALIVFVLHPVWILIFITPGCDQYRIVIGYELGLTIVKFMYLLLQLGLLTCCSTWQEEDSKPKFGNFAIGSTFYQLVQIGSDCWTISEILKLKSGIFCYDLPYRVQIATIVLSCLSFLVQLAHMIIVWCCLRDSSGVSRPEDA
jgi:hypothetical protein